MKQVNQKLQIYREFYTNSAVGALTAGVFAPMFSGQPSLIKVSYFAIAVISSYILLKLAELYAE